MTVATTTNSYTYNGNDLTTVFAFNSVFLDAADLTVILTSSAGVETVQTITTHYTVSGGSGSTGSVTMVTAPATGEKLTIVRDPALTQTLDLVANDPLPAEELEQALDKAVMLLQRVAERIDRSVVIQDSDTGTLTLPVAADRASKYAAFDASGNLIASTGPTGASEIPVSSFVETLLDDTTASAFLDTLGGGTQGKSLFAAATAAAALALVTPTTTRGDMIARGASADGRIGPSAAGQVPVYDGTDTAFGFTGCTQVVAATPVTALQTITAVIASDDTIPQNTEGTEILTVTITPKSATSTLVIEFLSQVVDSGGQRLIAALFQDSTANALSAAEVVSSSAGHSDIIAIRHTMTSGGTSATTFKVRVGVSSGTGYLNGYSGARKYGGVAQTTLTVSEII